MGCPAFSKATAASLTVSASFASEARTTSQQTLCRILLKTHPSPSNTTSDECRYQFAGRHEERPPSGISAAFLFVRNVLCLNFVCLNFVCLNFVCSDVELYLFDICTLVHF